MVRYQLFFSILALGTSVGLCAPASVAGSSSPLTITQNTQIPGETLKPGDYSITVVDQLADRMIVRVDSQTGNHHALFLAVQGKGGDAGQGALLWPTGLNKTLAMRGFRFTNGSEVEFVYPKVEAAGLAKANSAKVVAVDPESEGHSASIKNLSKDELQVVNLWMLSLTTAGADGKTPAVLAQRFEGYGDRNPATYVASSEVRQAAVTPAAPVQVAKLEEPAIAAPVTRPARRAPVVAQLPHTAGEMPLVGMLGLLSVLGAAGVRFARMWMGRRALA